MERGALHPGIWKILSITGDETMNVICLTGRLGQDPELRRTQSGVAVVSFSLAVNRPHVKDATDWIKCTAWRQRAEFLAKYAHKGDRIGVSGMLAEHRYEDNEGRKRVTHEVICDAVEILQSREGGGGVRPAGRAVDVDGFDEIDDDGDLPF